MENILTLNQSIFGTKSTERKISRRALKASVQELYIPQESEEITYDEGYEVDGGIAISAIRALGVCGAAVSITCSIVLALDSIGWIKLSFCEKMGFKVFRFAGDIASTCAFLSLASKKIVGNFVAKILSKKFGGVVGANVLAFAFKSTSNLSHFASLFE
jgi:hypothetical protein